MTNHNELDGETSANERRVMTKPINTPDWLFREGAPLREFRYEGSKRRRVNRTEPGHPEYVPPPHRQIVGTRRKSPRITEVVLELHARELSKTMGRKITKDQAQSDINYGSKKFRGYLSAARKRINAKQGTESERERSDEVSTA